MAFHPWDLRKHILWDLRKHILWDLRKHILWDLRKHILWDLRKHILWDLGKHLTSSPGVPAVCSQRLRAAMPLLHNIPAPHPPALPFIGTGIASSARSNGASASMPRPARSQCSSSSTAGPSYLRSAQCGVSTHPRISRE